MSHIDEFNAAMQMKTPTGYRTAQVIASRRASHHDNERMEAKEPAAATHHAQACQEWSDRADAAGRLADALEPRPARPRRKSPPVVKPDWETEIPTAALRRF